MGIFILPPSIEELARRLRGRGTETEDVVQNRLAAAKRELCAAEHYAYAVVNDTVEAAIEKIDWILGAERCKVSRNRKFIEGVLNHD